MTAQTFLVASTDLASIKLAETSRHYRKPKGFPSVDREALRDKYDFSTLFFDFFFTEDGKVRGIGPRPLNLLPVLELSKLDFGSGGTQIRHRDDIAFSRTNKLIRLDVSSESDSRQLVFTPPKEAPIARTIQPSGLHLFSGKRVLMTMIKYDPLEWLEQWVEFFVRAHGIDAVLIYNNNAPDYTSSDIASRLQHIEGLDQIGVVDWFFPYGAGVIKKGDWSTAYCQVGAMAHARSRFLGKARCVVNADVDELVFCKNPGQTLCDLTEKSVTGYLNYRYRWASGPNGLKLDIPPHERRYANSYFINTSVDYEGNKWACVPSRCSDKNEFAVDTIPGLQADEELSAQVTYRNLPEFNTGWKTARALENPRLQEDPIMLRTYQKIGWR